MANVFKKETIEGAYVQLSNGRMICLDALIEDYEKLITTKEVTEQPKEMPKKQETAISRLEVGKWFRIDRRVIQQNAEIIYDQCYKQGDEGKALLERFKEANLYAEKHPEKYTDIIETLIFPFDFDWEFKTEEKMRRICKVIGDDMCDEVICYLELQMRICNGESVHELIQKADKLPVVRVIKTRDGGTGFFGGNTRDAYEKNNVPSKIYVTIYSAESQYTGYYTPYMYRRLYK